jgi:hypothetical protein
MPCVRR